MYISGIISGSCLFEPNRSMKGLHNRSIKQETVVKLFDLAMGVRKIDKYYERIEVYLLCHSRIIIV